MRSPLAPLVVSYIAGILLGNSLQAPAPAAAAFPAFILFAVLILHRLQKKRLILCCLLLGFFSIGVFNIGRVNDHAAASRQMQSFVNAKEKLCMEGMVASAPQSLSGLTEVTISALSVAEGTSHKPVDGRMLLSIQGGSRLDYGDIIRFKTVLRTPYNFNNPGRFDFERKLLHQGIYARGFVKDGSGIAVIRKKQGDILKTRIESFRSDLKLLIEQHAPYPESKIIQASILGNQKEIPDDVMDRFNRTGTSHIIAISGFNIGIIAMLSFLVIRSLMKSSEYLMLRFSLVKTASIIAVIPIVVFTMIAGAGISVVRATIMVITFMVSHIFDKDRDLWNALALAAFVILVFSPYSLFDVSFQLSFAAVISILFISPKLARLIPENRASGAHEKPAVPYRAFRGFIMFIIVTFSATLGTLPLAVFHFNRISTVVLPANLAVVPVLGIMAVPVCTSIIVAAPLSTSLAVALIKLSSFLVGISLRMVDFFASLPFSSLFVTTPSPAEIIVFYLLVISLVMLLEAATAKTDAAGEEKAGTGKKRLPAAAAACCLIFFAVDLALLHTADNRADELRITFIDVGQGNAALLKLPGGRAILVDGGGSFNGRFDIGQRVIAPFLWHERIDAVDIVVLTHPHPDHMNGLLYILENFKVKELWTNGEASAADTWLQMISLAGGKGIRHRLISAKTHPEIQMDGVSIRVLNPHRPRAPSELTTRKYRLTNNDSLVLKISYGGNAILLPADISGETEHSLVHSRENLQSRIMLVPHHGGYTSSTPAFLERVKPEFAVISCGRDNPFGLPHPEVLERYRKTGTRLLRTDRHGAVTFRMNGGNISLEQFLPRR